MAFELTCRLPFTWVSQTWLVFEPEATLWIERFPPTVVPDPIENALAPWRVMFPLTLVLARDKFPH